jgi:hypothetical protein
MVPICDRGETTGLDFNLTRRYSTVVLTKQAIHTVYLGRAVHLQFVVEKVALGQVFLRDLRFSLISVIPSGFSTLISGARWWPQLKT